MHRIVGTMIGITKSHKNILRMRHRGVILIQTANEGNMPESDRAYGQVQYWNDRYTKCVPLSGQTGSLRGVADAFGSVLIVDALCHREAEEFEWYQAYDNVKDKIKAAFPDSNGKIINLGSGSSRDATPLTRCRLYCFRNWRRGEALTDRDPASSQLLSVN